MSIITLPGVDNLLRAAAQIIIVEIQLPLRRPWRDRESQEIAQAVLSMPTEGPAARGFSDSVSIIEERLWRLRRNALCRAFPILLSRKAYFSIA